MPDKWAQYAHPADNSDSSGDRWAAYATDASADLSANPSREGLYRMTDAGGRSLHVPYSRVRDAAQAGYVMAAEDRPRFVTDSAADPFLARDLFPDIPLPQGVRIAGMNTAGEPIFAPAETTPQGSAARRFLSSATRALAQPIAGIWQGLTRPAQTPTEKAIEQDQGRLGMVGYRFLLEPNVEQAKAAYSEARQGAPQSDHPTQEQLWHRQKAAAHALAAAIPLLGPAAAQLGEQIGTQVGVGDIAGSAGTAAGNVALYAAPEALGRVARSEFVSRTIPEGQITRMIRPLKADRAFGKDPAGAILREGITGNDLEQIGDRTYDRLHEVGAQIDAQALKPQNAAKTVNLTQSLKPLDSAMREASRAGDRSLFAKLLDVKNELSNNWKPFRSAAGEITLRSTGPRNLKMSPYDAIQFKRMVGDRIRWTQDPLDGPVNQALGEVYGRINDSTNSAVPGLRELNQRYANLVGAAKAIERRLPVEARNAHWSLSDIVLGSTGHIPVAVTRHVLRLPAVRSRVAQGLYRLPDIVPARPAATVAPAIAAAQAQGARQRLRELQAEAAARRPAAVQ